VEHEQLTLPKHLTSPPVLSEIHLARYLVFSECLFVLFLLDIVLSVLRFTIANVGVKH
jgi:hypothetical protein